MNPSQPWEPKEMQDAPPLVCEYCAEEVPDGAGWLHAGGHFLCASCSSAVVKGIRAALPVNELEICR